MNFKNDILKLVKEFSDDSTDTHAKAGLGTAYWSMLIDSVCDTVIKDGKIDSFILAEKNFIDVGSFPKVSGDADKAYATIFNTTKNFEHLDVISVTDFLKLILLKINSGEEKERLERQIKSSKIKKNRFFTEFSAISTKRTQLLQNAFDETIDPQKKDAIKEIPKVERLVFENLRIKRSIAAGHFMDVEAKREFVAKTRELDEKLNTVEMLYKSVSDDKDRIELREIVREIGTIRSEILNYEEKIVSLNRDLKKIINENLEITNMDIECSFRKEIEFLRENVKLSGRRYKQDNFSFYDPTTAHITLTKLHNALDIILEFDPKIFNTTRIAIYGKPKVLLVPGNGSGVYDWKNNIFIIPQTPYTKDIIPSIAAAIMEYRLDTDEDKILLNSYQKLSTKKDIKSLITLKDSLTKDYIKWLTNEYKGFKVFDKEIREWFERNVGPSKHEIYTPPELQPFLFSSKEIKELFNDNEKVYKNGSENEKATAAWRLSVVESQNGNYQKSYDYIEAAKKFGFQHRFLDYNRGVICSKIARIPESIEAFTTFTSKNSQGWWSAIARDHIRRFQT